MSLVDSSDSDDFFDARQDLGSPNSPASPSLIVEENEDNLCNKVVNPNSPNKLGADLILDHLIQSVSESTSEDILKVEENEVVAGVENDKTTNHQPSSSSDVFVSMHKNLMEAMKSEEDSTDQNFLKGDLPTDTPTLHVVEASPVTSSFKELASDECSLNKQSVNHEWKSETQKQSIEETHTHQANKNYNSLTQASLLDSAKRNEEEIKMECSEKSGETLAQPVHQPDLVASIKERPSNLPGLHSFHVHAEQTGSHPHTEIKKPLTHMSHSPARPKRPPPPRPKAPPRRPPKSAPPSTLKPYLSSIDDGLLTPNSTVDNITREFESALHSEDVKTESISSKSGSSSLNSLNKSIVGESVPSKSEVPSTERQSETSSKRNSITSSQPPKPSFSLSGNSQIDEGIPWSEMTKRTVLRIDSSPGLEILSTVIVRNLDTGQTMPLSVAAEQVSQCLNPLALQIMSRTKEFSCATAPGSAEEQGLQMHKPQPAELTGVLPNDDDSLSVASDDITIGVDASSGRSFHERSRRLKMQSKRLKKVLNKGARRVKEAAGTQVERAVHKVKYSKADGPNSESLNVSSDEDVSDSFASASVKTKASSSHKGPYPFSRPKLVQDIAVHVGAVWSMKFSHCGRLLATAGQNNVIWVWVLKDYYAFFNDLRSKYDSKERGVVFATPPRNSMDPPSNSRSHSRSTSDEGVVYSTSDELDEEEDAPFRSLPFSSYVGHTADVLDLAWSKNYFTLSSSMDKTVRLWHVSQKECLCCFQHIDFVTAISFHPRDDRYFLSGSLDSKLRLWNIPDKKVALWNEVPPDSSGGSSGSGGALITTVNFCENGKFAVCGTYDGRCLFYDTEHLKYHTQIHVRSSRGRNTKGHKITGIEPLSGEHKILVTSNDSRVRLYDLRDLSLTCKFKGLTNLSSQIKASFSHDNKYIICGSEDKSLYIWRTNPPQDVKLSSFRRDRNDAWESIRAHDAVVTCAVFAPYPHLMANTKAESGSRLSLQLSKKSAQTENFFIISADFNGVIKVFSNT